MPRLVYASSSSVYGLNKKQPFSESDRVDSPASLYASTKRVREHWKATVLSQNVPQSGMSCVEAGSCSADLRASFRASPVC